MSKYIPDYTRDQSRTMTTAAVVSMHKGKTDVHRALIADLAQTAKHGDTSDLQRLVNGIGYGKLVLKKYIEAHSPVKFAKLKNDDFKLTAKGWQEFEWDFRKIEKGLEDMNKRWDNFAKESEPKPYGVDDLMTMLKRVANDDGKSKRPISIEAKLAAKKALAAIEAA